MVERLQVKFHRLGDFLLITKLIIKIRSMSPVMRVENFDTL